MIKPAAREDEFLSCRRGQQKMAGTAEAAGITFVGSQK
jgi:hypothetical protein